MDAAVAPLDFNLLPLLPELFLVLTGMGLLILGVFQGNHVTRIICWASVVSYLIASVIILGLSWESQIVLEGMFKFDKFAGFLKLMILIGLMASMALSVRYIIQERMERFEYPVLMTFAGIGMMLMVSSNNLLSLYMALELQSLSLYVLAAFNRKSIRSSEAGSKYFILGALSSGLLLFGISLVYGFTGSIDFGAIEATLAVADPAPLGVIFGLVFVLAGLAFKISAAPFHMWTPDVYQGAPTTVTALFAMVPKVAAVGLLVRLLFEPFSPITEQWSQVIYLLSVASMVVGAFGALAQENIKRLMAYSAIGHMGYILIGVVAGGEIGVGAVVLYLLIYLMMSAGVFAVILSMRRDNIMCYKIDDLRGLRKTSPVLAYAMAALMFSMAGIPPLAGFFGKLFIFEAAVMEGYIVLAVIGVLTSVVAAYYYLRIVKVMFFDESADAFDDGLPFARRAVLFISVVFVLTFVLKPMFIIEAARGAASALFLG